MEPQVFEYKDFYIEIIIDDFGRIYYKVKDIIAIIGYDVFIRKKYKLIAPSISGYDVFMNEDGFLSIYDYLPPSFISWHERKILTDL